jgi:hypothetical protein
MARNYQELILKYIIRTNLALVKSALKEEMFLWDILSKRKTTSNALMAKDTSTQVILELLMKMVVYILQED